MTLNIFRSRKGIKELKEVTLNNFMEVLKMYLHKNLNSEVNSIEDVNCVEVEVEVKEVNCVEDVEITEYKSNPIIRLPFAKNRMFGFGYHKAVAIIDHVQEIMEFVSLCDSRSELEAIKKQNFAEVEALKKRGFSICDSISEEVI